MQDFATVYAALRKILVPYAAKLDTKKDDEAELYVDTKHIQKNKKPLFFLIRKEPKPGSPCEPLAA